MFISQVSTVTFDEKNVNESLNCVDVSFPTNALQSMHSTDFFSKKRFQMQFSPKFQLNFT